MEKVHHLITDRWSPVAFDQRPVEPEKINILFKAASWAPSGRNAQPWRFVYATREMADYHLLFDLINEGNKIWAKTAPLLILGLAQVVSTYKNRPNRLALYELGMAVSNLLLQATHMGLFVHQMGGYDDKGAREVLAIPGRYEPAAMMAVGYKGDIRQLPPEFAERENGQRTRKEVGEFLIPGKCN
jgi:nitroreductase